MGIIYTNKISEIRREKNTLERKLKVDIKIFGRNVIFEGEPLNEYEAELVFEAIDAGFPAHVSLLLTEEHIIFEKLNIKDYTRRKNLKLIRGRIIGEHGRTKRTIEQISGCRIALKDNTVGIIGPAELIPEAITGIISLIQGTKQSNVYKFLEKRNTLKKKKK